MKKPRGSDFFLLPTGRERLFMQDIKKVVIVGAGTMGHSLALLFAKEGLEVNLVDKDPDPLERAISLIDSARKTLLQADCINSDSREAFSLVDQEYANIEDVDRAVKRSLGIRIPSVGVLQTYDFTGLDVYHKICQENPVELPTSSSPPNIVKEKVEHREFGIKTGKGLYDCSGKKPEEILQRRDLNYIGILRAINKSTPL
jgi:3-hydroxyacyl-CoA dehydrogenase